MKSYIYIVITKELFRRSIAGGSTGAASGGVPPTLPLVPPEQDFVGLRPRASCRGAGGCGAELLCLGAGLGTALEPDPAAAPILALVLPLVAQAHHGDGPPGRPILQRFMARSGEWGCPLSCCRPAQRYMKGLSAHRPVINAPPVFVRQSLPGTSVRSAG